MRSCREGYLDQQKDSLMKLTPTERWVAVVNIAMVLIFSAWSFGVAHYQIPLSACCNAPSYVEAVLATLNFPSWLPAALAANALPHHDLTALVAVKQLVWIALCVPQWWAYISIFRFWRNRRAPPA